MFRMRSLDLARGFTVLMMAPVHTVLLYSDPAIYQTFLVRILAFIAEGPGGQLFMMLMGMYVGLSQTLTAKKVAAKSGWLLLAGYGLNMIKFVVPHELGILPDNLLRDLEITNESGVCMQLLAIGDIFHFAAFALPITYAFGKGRAGIATIGLIVLIIAASPYVWDMHSNNPASDYLLQLVGGQPPRIFFPLCPWLVYPLIGMLIGKRRLKTEASIFTKLAVIGVLMLLIPYSIRLFLAPKNPINFYRTEWPETLQHIGIVFCALFCWDWLNRNIPQNPFFNLLQYSSRHITRLYITQWIVIMWCLPIAGYQQLLLLSTIAWIILTTAVTYLTVYVMVAYQEFASVTNK